MTGRSTTKTLRCRKCTDSIVLTAPSVRFGPKVPLRDYVSKMAEQWEWQIDDPHDPRCPLHKRGTASGEAP